jgi:hypothetical protein
VRGKRTDTGERAQVWRESVRACRVPHNVTHTHGAGPRRGPGRPCYKTNLHTTLRRARDSLVAPPSVDLRPENAWPGSQDALPDRPALRALVWAPVSIGLSRDDDQRQPACRLFRAGTPLRSVDGAHCALYAPTVGWDVHLGVGCWCAPPPAAAAHSLTHSLSHTGAPGPHSVMRALSRSYV